MNTMTTRSYSDMKGLLTWDERFDYLRLRGGVGRSTFGFDRYVNQRFYTSREWKDVRKLVIARDNGCDLGIQGYEIHSGLLIHHMNPLAIEDIIGKESWVLDPEFLITVTHATHNAIHYGVDRDHPKTTLNRSSNDTKLW